MEKNKKTSTKTTLWIVLSIPLLLLIIGCACLFIMSGCSKKENHPPKKLDFESLMGKDLPSWQYVQTREDFENLGFFKTLYDKNKLLLFESNHSGKIPKVIHFIWIGPKNFPVASVENIKSWVANHPDWTFMFWTDRERPLPHPKMQRMQVKDFNFLQLSDCYLKSENYAEKADVLRYEILYQQGGVYVDHDVKCMHAFDPLNETYDFYCGLEMPSTTCLSSSVHTTNNLIASKPGHPILKNCMQWLEEKWDYIERQYPGQDKESVIDRVAHRTFSAFSDSVRSLVDKGNNKDIVYPAFYFNAPDDSSALLARHLYAGTWFENESKFEKMARERLMLLSKKTNKILLICGVLGILNLFCFIILFVVLKKRKAY
jgi:hypothetical protein